MTLPPLPERSPRAKTMLTGAEIGKALSCMGVSSAQFCRVTGTNEVRFRKQLRSNDGDLPLYYEIALFALYNHAELRTTTEPIPLPFSEWGIDFSDVDE